MTPQYSGLESLHRRYGARGFRVLGFPCNQFGNQEPGTPEEIRTFCTESYEVSFPMFEKVEVKKGAGQHPVYAFLVEKTGEEPPWNFAKYLVGPDGTTVTFFGPRTAPDDEELVAAIEAALAAAGL